MRSKKSAIVEYYDTCEGDYRIFWDLDRSLAMHAGYWDSETKTLADALKRENEILAELAGVTSSDYVLDAGCGVGGSSIFWLNSIVAVSKVSRLAVGKLRQRQRMPRCAGWIV